VRLLSHLFKSIYKSYKTATDTIYCRFIEYMYLCIIAERNLHIQKLKEHFGETDIFSNKDILQFYKLLEPKVPLTTVNWRIYSLVQTGVLSRIGRGKFTLENGKIYTPTVTRKMMGIFKKLQKQFPYLQTCIWDTSILNEFMLHQPGRFYTVVEVNKDGMESVFYFLKEGFKNVFLNPNQDVIDHYISEMRDAIIVRILVSEAPIQLIQNLPTTTLEKLLVDIYSEDILFAAQQGREMQHIFKEALNIYTVNESRMLRFADRKGKKEELGNYLKKLSKYRQQMQKSADL
jgi:hypothetical protein